jgi:hypothetical protein
MARVGHEDAACVRTCHCAGVASTRAAFRSRARRPQLAFGRVRPLGRAGKQTVVFFCVCALLVAACVRVVQAALCRAHVWKSHCMDIRACARPPCAMSAVCSVRARVPRDAARVLVLLLWCGSCAPRSVHTCSALATQTSWMLGKDMCVDAGVRAELWCAWKGALVWCVVCWSSAPPALGAPPLLCDLWMRRGLVSLGGSQ